jgi:WD40 repeat protein
MQTTDATLHYPALDTIKVWTRAEPPSQKEQCVLYGHTDSVSCIAVHHSSGVLATGQSGPSPLVRLWNVAKAQCVAVIAVHVNGLVAMDISHDGRSLCTVGKDAHRRLQIVVWDISQVVAGLVSDSLSSPSGK